VDEAETCDSVVVGAGPAGRAAAAELASAGARVALVDERPDAACELAGFAVWDIWRASPDWQVVCLYHPDAGVRTVSSRVVVLATGDRARYVPFPGWTLAGVVNLEEVDWTDADPAGRGVVLVGTGPELLLHASRLMARGAHLLAVADDGDARTPLDALTVRALAGGGPSVVALLSAWVRLSTRGVAWLRRHVIAEALGDGRVQTVRLREVQSSSPTTSFDVDALCVAFGRQPATEVPFGIGAQSRFDTRRRAFVASRDLRLGLSVPGVFLAGTGGGVAQGTAWAVAEGTLAGIWAGVDLGLVSGATARERVRPVLRSIRRLRRVARLAGGRHSRVADLLAWATPETTVCRCEGVTLAQLQTAALLSVSDPNWLKGPTSAAMGACQGRACESAVALSVSSPRGQQPSDVRPLNVRPPFRPVPLRLVASETPLPERLQLIPGASG
jgi:thioredoxin reductase